MCGSITERQKCGESGHRPVPIQRVEQVGFVLIGDGPVYPIVGLLLGRG
jgi:hypothetical protein